MRVVQGWRGRLRSGLSKPQLQLRSDRRARQKPLWHQQLLNDGRCGRWVRRYACGLERERHVLCARAWSGGVAEPPTCSVLLLQALSSRVQPRVFTPYCRVTGMMVTARVADLGSGAEPQRGGAGQSPATAA